VPNHPPSSSSPPPPETANADPASRYRGLVASCDRERLELQRKDGVIVAIRLLAFLAFVALAAAAWKTSLPAIWMIGPGALYAVAAVVHSRVFARRRLVDVATSLWNDGVARIEDRWTDSGDRGERFQAAAESHLFAADLDLYGRGGLFPLLSVARTPIGQATLAEWLEVPATVSQIRDRQSAVRELAPRLELRLELALAARTIQETVKEEALSAWAINTPTGLPAKLTTMRTTFALLGAASVATLAGWLAGAVSGWPFVAVLALGWLWSRRWRDVLDAIANNVDRRANELATLAAALRLLEREPFTSPALQALRASAESKGGLASQRIDRLRRLVEVLDGRHNQFGALFYGAVQATPQLTLAIEAWRRQNGQDVVAWMKAVGQLEALVSLGTFAFENPTYPFPEIRDDVAPSYSGEALGHPLIPRNRRVENDVNLGGDTPRRLLIVSGSNMSGKSTFLRTIGVNAVLALAGAPVCARRLSLSPLTIASTLRINDSLQEGKSRFYAELTRLKQVVDRAGQTPPVLFLLDEILHGTNSHDRRIGAEAIIRGLLSRGAIGLVTTHDLALAQVAETLGPQADNVHFEDHLEGGVMTFDYRVKAGIVRKSNALALMRAVGLGVDEPT